jgi:ADP-heptose:LPS heptosyltransferase
MIRMRSPRKRTAALVIDAVLARLAPLLTVGQSSAIPVSPRILLVRCDHIGDAAMATAVLQPLRDALRPSRLDVLAAPWASPVFETHPLVDRVLSVSAPWWSAARGARWPDRVLQWARLPGIVRLIRAQGYDVGIDLRGDLRQITFFLALGGMPVRVSSDRTGGRRLLTHVWPFDDSLHEVQKNLAVAALLGASGHPRMDVVATDSMPALLRSSLEMPDFAREYVVFALRGSALTKSWTPAGAAEVADLLRDQMGLGSVYVGGSADDAFARAFVEAARATVINLAGRTTLEETIAVLRGAKATIAVDSGPMHLAAGVGSPVVALFGPTDPSVFRPWSDRVRIVSHNAPCGCDAEQCNVRPGVGDCMRQIGAERVFNAVREVVRDEDIART